MPWVVVWPQVQGALVANGHRIKETKAKGIIPNLVYFCKYFIIINRSFS